MRSIDGLIGPRRHVPAELTRIFQHLGRVQRERPVEEADVHVVSIDVDVREATDMKHNEVFR